MKRLATAVLLALGASVSLGQEVQCVEVPEHHKVVFIPRLIPTDEITWTWSHAKDVVPVEGPEQVYVVCNPDLVVSPSVCEEGWQTVE